MNKTLVIVISVFLLIALTLFLKQQVGDIRPAVLPAPSNPPQTQSPSTQTPFSQKNLKPIGLPLKLPDRLQAGLFASNLGKARDLEFSPGGTLFVSITNTPEGKILALIDKDKDGIAEQTKTIISTLDNPHGLTFYNGKLFVAEETKVNRYNFDEDNISATFDKKILDLPKGRNHYTRSLIFDKNGKLYISVGSTCNVCVENHPYYAGVIVTDQDGFNPQVFASGLRNTVFMNLNPDSGEIWGADMGRDLIGDNIPPEEINILKSGKNYGWPYCYGDKTHDNSFDPQGNKRAFCETTETPIFKFQAHSAPLGLTFINSPKFPKEWQGDLLVSYHGSWNRSTPTGYKVVRMDVNENTISGESDFITGFLDGSAAAGRPVDLIFDKAGNLFLSDDKAGNVYIITSAP